MRKIWVKKPAEPKGYSFWDSELSDDENCLREDDFKNSVCFVPEARFNELEAKLKVAVEALEIMTDIIDTPERNQDDYWYEKRKEAMDLYEKVKQ